MSEQLEELHEIINSRRGEYDRIVKAWHGENNAAYMSKKSREALDSTLRKLGVNFPRLVVNSKVDRLSVSGMVRADDGTADMAAWQRWTRAGMVTKSEQVHTDYYLYGGAYVTVWADSQGNPAVTTGTPRSSSVLRDSISGEVTAALSRWTTRDGVRCRLVTPDAITVYGANGTEFYGSGSQWRVMGEPIENTFGVVPVVPFIRSQSSEDDMGVSAVEDILDLSDALAKVLGDAMVTSEHFARPRRWATGLEIEETEDGEVVDPFRKESHLQSEAPDTKFGQFPSADLAGYENLIATLTQQIGSLTGLPPHYLGLHGDQPGNADGVRAAEAQLASAAYSDHRALNGPWSRVAQLMAGVTDPAVNLTATETLPSWSSPEIRTPAQAADAALKQRDIGIPLETVLVETLGYSPARAADIARTADRANIAAAAGNLGKLVP